MALPDFLDFPNAPTNGQLYPDPAVAGVPVYRWDGQKWTTLGGAIGSVGASDALPLMNGVANAGLSTQWTRGDHRHPTDTSIAAGDAVLQTNIDAKYDKTGGTLTGNVVISKANPALQLMKTATAQSNIIHGLNNGALRWQMDLGDAAPETGGDAGSNFYLRAYSDAGAQTALALDVQRNTGLVIVKGDPTVALGVATKQYVDSKVAAASAAPIDALAYNGMQINGAIEIGQEYGTGLFGGNGYVVDGFAMYRNGSMVPSAGSRATAGGLPPGYTSYLGITIPTAQASLGAGEYLEVIQPIEGFRTSRLAWGTVNAQPITVGFWSGHVRTGTYSLAIQNGASDRHHVITYTQNASAVFEYKTAVIPGCTDGTWQLSTGVGMFVTFAVACGATYTTAAANVWATGNKFAAPGQVNGVAATSDVFAITGLVVLPGTHTLTAARSALLLRPYGEELQTCRRYYEKVGMTITALSGNYENSSWFRASKRATPALSWTNANGATVQVISATPLEGVRQVTNPAGAIDINITANSRL